MLKRRDLAIDLGLTAWVLGAGALYLWQFSGPIVGLLTRWLVQRRP